MLTGKQRAYLRGLANGIDPIFQIGKGGISEEQLKGIAEALELRELIKIKILETALLDTKETANDVAARLKAEPVQAIGSKFVIYKRANKEEHRHIEFPKKK